MYKNVKRLLGEDTGAVTVDWIVLTAAGVGLAIAAATMIRNSSDTLTDRAGAAMTAQQDNF